MDLKKPQLRILFILNGLGVGGAEIQTVSLANALFEKGHHVTLLSLDTNTDIRSRISVGISVINLLKHHFLDLKALMLVAACIRKERPDVICSVNSHSTLYAWFGRLLSPDSLPAKRVPILSIQHTTVFGKEKDGLKNLLYMPINRNVESICFVCRAQKEYWGKRYRIGDEKSYVIYNGIDLSKFANYVPPQEPFITNHHKDSIKKEPSFTVCMIAAFRPEKRHGDLLEAVSMLKEEGHAIKLVFVGDGALRSSVEVRAESMGLGSNTLFTGNVDDVRPWLACCDVFALTSGSVETLSIAAIEAMAAGKALVMSDVGGASDLVVDGINGYLYPAGDVKALANCLRSMMQDGSTKRFGRESLARCLANHDARKMTDSYEVLLEQLVARKKFVPASMSGEHTRKADEKEKNRVGKADRSHEGFSVIHLGPSLQTKGGISSVLNLYHDWFVEEHATGVLFIPTYDGNSRIRDILYFTISIIRTVGWCLSGRKLLFHVHTASKGSWFRKSILAGIVRFFGKPFLLHMHGGGFERFMFSGSTRKTERIVRCLREADRVIALSDRWHTFYAKWVDLDRIITLPNPTKIAGNVLMPGNDVEAPIKFLYMGKVSEEKGTYDLVRAASRLCRSRFVIDIYGNGELAGISRFVDDADLADSVHVHGWVPFHRASALYGLSDILVLPSYAEGLPMTVLEAMGQGRPVIATRVGGIPDAVVDGTTGFLIEAGDIDALAAAMSRFIDNPELVGIMGERAHDRAKEFFDIQVIGKQLMGIYLDVLLDSGIS